MLDERLFRGISVYQDVVLDGRTVRRGSRDCEARWALMAPVLTECRSVLDVGSNFGWFGLRFCELRADGVVASVEADLRSAAVQRCVLQSHVHRRLCLLTRPATARLVRTFERHTQRFDAAFCLSVLHWIPEHRALVEGLGRLCDRLIVEHPDPDEPTAGVERLRREIGPIGPYLRRCFPDRPIRKLGETESHLHRQRRRELWLVAPSATVCEVPSPGLIVPALLDLGVSWPPRSWWLEELAKAQATTNHVPVFTPRGLEPATRSCNSATFSSIRRRIRRIPEHRATSAGELVFRRSRSVLASTVRNLGKIRRAV